MCQRWLQVFWNGHSMGRLWGWGWQLGDNIRSWALGLLGVPCSMCGDVERGMVVGGELSGDIWPGMWIWKLSVCRLYRKSFEWMRSPKECVRTRQERTKSWALGQSYQRSRIQGVASKGDKEWAASEVRYKPGERALETQWRLYLFPRERKAKNVSNATDRSCKKRN